ncbi:phosphofurin acidic cluster sorting protein 1 [Parasteatoda tepidariorum]|nr:phosphofurin acidic cluster sorting protein 1 [Parasteatoda tepidariorum]XP_015912438.1 phosphofurin acidic cluster sorting protein 1 [Parasteatoda tepidariorum]XP_015912439.1 phosphofurin acidic cluster sorting protein 1 [Parasteatoda tepidariorum]XP_042910228.1 phosphofurin acidic cluster sorting protein 1 [Parasteatoda tepidariorum]XP_042910229.1 phosphofurin acidic cluster sorting protein 1 [Parasteatoda tepidariorum]XP_042910230.1 phosphofurin acidic cluster sorting protein 1 [Parastea
MAEKPSKPSNVWGKPVPMKLFAAWEVDRTPPNCIPRLCTLNLTRLVLLKPVVGEMNSVTIAVKMQSSKRILRSNEILALNNGLIDTELDLTFSLQYPHFLKRCGNNLQIMLQRRKRYKNRAILGFKTLACGIINMAEVLQRPMDKELELHSNNKEKSEVIAKVLMYAISSQPVDHEEIDRQKSLRGMERTVEVDNFSDEEEEYTSNEDGCDSEPVVEDSGAAVDSLNHSHLRKSMNPKLFQNVDRPDPAERNIKQKIIALLKKFRIPEAEVSDSEQYQEELEQELISQNPQEFEDLIDELESMSDSGPDVDDISISSTPKPSLRPFFSSGTLTAIDKNNMPMISDDSSKKTDDNHESGTDQENTDTSQTASPPKSLTMEEKKTFSPSGLEKDKKAKLFAREKSSSKDKRTSNAKEGREKLTYEKSASKDSECSPQKTVLEQLAKIFPTDDSIPDHVIVVNAIDVVGNCLAVQLIDRNENVITILSNSDLRASFSCLMNKIQKFCNCNSRAPQTIKIGILGHDSFFSSVLRLYVEHFSTKPSEWQAYVKFCLIPLSSSTVSKSLSSIDNAYSNVFMDSSWKDLLDHCSETSSTPEIELTVNRIMHFINNASYLWQMAIAEAMVTYKEKSSDEESSQVFIPFVTDVKIGIMESVTQTTSVDSEELTANLTVPGNSPPCTITEKGPRESTTPPSSPSISSAFLGNTSGSAVMSAFGETMDLQLDYWIMPQKGEANKKTESSKLSLKTTFRNLHVSRTSSPVEPGSSSLTLTYVTKEKKQKIMRLGKKKEKEKELDNRYQQVEGIHRLICSCRTLQTPLKVTIDGVEWSGVKFFQLTSQWQTHIKYFPVALYSMIEHPC